MAKLHFVYSVMNAGKTTLLLQTRHNYLENNQAVLLFTSAKDTRTEVGKIQSRIGLEADAHPLRNDENLFDIVEKKHATSKISAVLLDEVNFMTPEHIEQASDIVDFLGIPVIAYGLKNNAFGEIFGPSISKLLALSEDIKELKTTCHCGRKATMILRYGEHGKIDRNGDVVKPGGEQEYVSVCRKHYKMGDIGDKARAIVNASGKEFLVHCSQCDIGYKAMTHDQGDGCAAYIEGNEIHGTYGSAVADLTRFHFKSSKPANIGNGIVCDECLRGFQKNDLIVVTHEFVNISDLQKQNSNGFFVSVGEPGW